LFVKKHGNRNQLSQFYFCWLPWCLLRLSAKAIIFWGKDGFKIMRWLFSWVKEWYKLTHKKEK
jgi:hypothetical protein